MENKNFQVLRWDLNFNNLNKLASFRIPSKDFQIKFINEMKKATFLELLVELRYTFLADQDAHFTYTEGMDFPQWKHITILNYILENYEKK